MKAAGIAPSSVSVPLVAYRGLWDKFAAPGTSGALRRAYSRGVPSVVCLTTGEPSLAEALAIVADAGVNRRGLPIYLMTSSMPPGTALAAAPVVTPGIFAIARGRDNSPWPISRFDRHTWMPVGCYLPVATAMIGLSPAELDLVASSSLVLFESLDVVTDLCFTKRTADRNDEQTLASICACAASGATIARVCDLVELELLQQRTREAA